MTLAEESERAKTADKVPDYKSAITGAIDNVKSYKSDLQKLKTDMQAKTTIYSASDISEIDALLADLQDQALSI